MSIQLVGLTPEEHHALGIVLEQRAPRDAMSGAWPLEVRTAYEIGWMDAILRAADLLSNYYLESRQEKGTP